MNSTFTPENPLFIPQNDQVLSEMEKHVQATLGSQLNMNITSRRANKLRDLTCALAGFSGGYQQLKKHWENQSQGEEQKGLLWDLLLSALNRNSSMLEILQTVDGYKCNNFIDGKYIMDREVGEKDSEQYHELVKSAQKLPMTFKGHDLNSTGEIKIGQETVILRMAYLITASGFGSINIKILKLNKSDAPVRLEDMGYSAEAISALKALPENKDSIDDIGITSIEGYKELLSKKSGIILTCGLAGSGKTTTERLLADQFCLTGNKNTLKCISPVRSDSKKSDPQQEFKDATKALMRSRADCLIMGEIRTREQAEFAIKAAENGALVLATLHASGIQGAVLRFGILAMDNAAVQENLIGVLMQGLANKVCGKCNGVGCGQCDSSGEKGKTVISEFYDMSDPVSVRIMLRGDHVQRSWASYIEDALKKHYDNVISRQEMIRLFGHEFEKLQQMIQQ